MKKMKLSAIILAIGLAIELFFTVISCNLYSSDNDCALGAGMLTIWFAWPLILIGVILFIIGFISWIMKRRRSS